MLPSFIALRHISTRRRQTALSILAIGLAVAISVTSVSLQSGFRDMLLDIIIEDLPHVSVAPKEGEDYIYLYKTLMDRIQAMPGVDVVSPSLGAAATFSHKDNVENVAMSGVVPSDMDKIFASISKNMARGDLISIQDGTRVVMGDKLADRLNVKVGDNVVASFPDARTTRLTVSGIFNTPTGWPDDISFVSLDTARTFVNKGNVISSLDIKLNDIYKADAIKREISSYGYEAQSWQELYPDILRTIAIEGVQNTIVLLLIMIIAAFGIGSVMYMLVNEKTKEIGMLMAMGASSSSIRNIFLYESMVLGLLGGIAGSIVGLALSLYLKSLDINLQAPGGEEITLPVIINPQDYITIIALAVILSLIAGAYPAIKASRLDPVEALKG